MFTDKWYCEDRSTRLKPVYITQRILQPVLFPVWQLKDMFFLSYSSCCLMVSWAQQVKKWTSVFCGSIQSVKPSYGKNTIRTDQDKATGHKSFHQYLILISLLQVFVVVVVSFLKFQSVSDPILFNSLCTVSRQCLGDRKDLQQYSGSFDDLPRQWDHSHHLSWLLSNCVYWSKYWSSRVRALAADLIEMLFLNLPSSLLTSSGKFKWDLNKSYCPTFFIFPGSQQQGYWKAFALVQLN